ncbi:DUF1810 domain-containing protein [Pedobacter xixiisoli]|uniref:Uncharacterized protein, DUF1810 family n=1 Tax=Pedobacter xixiisoli TaxID=1476464 RepID=A0A285ZWD5_9SPHI|nr:DUF1810 domain-containing protein [Pedobacter xixiisoli]SOD13952.1 Uncharacterized protein, DUF1810 family [Pedobacter xixiisoli]
MNKDLVRFIAAQNKSYDTALSEIRSGRKHSHWMWYIFPQLKGLGYSQTAKHYAIEDLAEATAYLNHPILGKNLVGISKAVFELERKTAREIFGTPDDLKLRSSMTLFAQVSDTHPIFRRIIDKYFDGKPDSITLELLET